MFAARAPGSSRCGWSSTPIRTGAANPGLSSPVFTTGNSGPTTDDRVEGDDQAMPPNRIGAH